MVSLSYKITSFVLLVFALASWVLSLAGVSSLTKKCNDNPDYSKSECGKQLQYEWWGVWFEFIVLVVCLILAFFGRFGGGNMSTLQSFLVLVTSVLMIDIRTAIDSITFGSTGALDSDEKQINQAWQVAAAGWVLCSIANFILILLLGWGADLEVAVVNKGPAKSKDVEIAAGAPKA